MELYTDGIAELTLEARDLGGSSPSTPRASGWRSSRARTTGSGSRPGRGSASACGRRAPRSSTTRAGATCTTPSRRRPGRLDALKARLEDHGAPVRGPVEHEGGDRSIYVEDPEGNVVEVWDFFTRGEGSDEGVDALA